MIKFYVSLLYIINYFIAISLFFITEKVAVLHFYDPVQLVLILCSLIAAILLCIDDFKKLKNIWENKKHEEIKLNIIINILDIIIKFQMLNWFVTTILNIYMSYFVLNNNIDFNNNSIYNLALIVRTFFYCLVPSFYLTIILIIGYISKLTLKKRLEDIKIDRSLELE